MAPNNDQKNKISAKKDGDGHGGDVDVYNPANIRVLAIDANVVCLKYLVAVLKKCEYKVTWTTEAAEALKILRENINEYQIVITDVVRFDMDGFKLMETIALEMDIPVIMISAEDSKSSIMKGIRHGAREYLVKPVGVNDIKNIWKHVYRKRLSESSDKSASRDEEEGEEESVRLKKHKAEEEKEEEYEEIDQPNSTGSAGEKKTRLKWLTELHLKFLDAIQKLESNGVHPKRIRELMGEEGLRREHIASHLQKYRMILKKHKDGKNEKGKSSSHWNQYFEGNSSTSNVYGPHHGIIARDTVQNSQPSYDSIYGTISGDLFQSSQPSYEGNSHVNISYGRYGASDLVQSSHPSSTFTLADTTQLYSKPIHQFYPHQNFQYHDMLMNHGMHSHEPVRNSSSSIPVTMVSYTPPAPEFKGLKFSNHFQEWNKFPVSHEHMELSSQFLGHNQGSRGMSPLLYRTVSCFDSVPPRSKPQLAAAFGSGPITSADQNSFSAASGQHGVGSSSNLLRSSGSSNFGGHVFGSQNHNRNPAVFEPKIAGEKPFVDEEINEMIKLFNDNRPPPQL